MKEIPKITYIFRKPQYPVIVGVDGILVCGKSEKTLSRRLSKIKLMETDTYHAIDSRFEGWSFHPKHWALSPLAIKKRWTKLELIKLYNQRKNRDIEDPPYSEKSLSSKRLDKIFNDIVQLLNRT